MSLVTVATGFVGEGLAGLTGDLVIGNLSLLRSCKLIGRGLCCERDGESVNGTPPDSTLISPGRPKKSERRFRSSDLIRFVESFRRSGRSWKQKEKP